MQKEVMGGINNLVCFSSGGDNWDLPISPSAACRREVMLRAVLSGK